MSEGAIVLMLSLGAAAVLVAVTANLGRGAEIAGIVILGIGVVLLSIRILRGRPTRPDGKPEPPTES